MSDDEQPLRTGWDPGVPAGDTLTRAFLLNSAESLVSPVSAMGGRVLSNDALVATDLDRLTAFVISVTLLQPLNEQNLDDVLAQVHEFYGFGKPDSEFKGEVMFWSAWPTPDLRSRGWNLAGHPPLHLLPAGAVAPPDPPGLEIRLVTNKAELETFEE